MKLTCPHLPTLAEPAPLDLVAAIDKLAALGEADPSLPDRFVILEADDGTGAFIQAIAVDGHATWHVEVSNGSEAALRGLRQAVSRGRTIEYLNRFMNGERSLGNGGDWLDVDEAASRRTVTPAGLAIVVLILLAAAVALYAWRQWGGAS